MTLALSMIVRDAAGQLEACLASARSLVDEIVIADTGSTDGTPGLAWRLGARVLLTPWEEDFADARNRALAEVRADWVLVLDADERLDTDACDVLPALLDDPSTAGYQVTIRNYTLSLGDHVWDRPAVANDGRLAEASRYPAFVTHQNVRLFRRSPGIHFIGRVHESVGPAIVGSGGRLGRCDLLIHHFGLADDAETRRHKNELYRKLGRKKVKEMPASAQAHFELGLVEFDNFHNDQAALDCFEEACRLNPRLAVAWVFAALARARLGSHESALGAVARARRLGYAAPLLDEIEADALYNLGKFEAARRAYRAACRKLPGNAGLESKLGLAELRAGRRLAGLDRLRRSVTRSPQVADAHDRLIQALIWLDRPAEAAVAAEAKLVVLGGSASDYLRAASIRSHLGERAKAVALLQRGLECSPSSEKLRAVAASLGIGGRQGADGAVEPRSKVLAKGADSVSGTGSSVSRS
jgi:tetratricopeptide (TPR) repeat protein